MHKVAILVLPDVVPLDLMIPMEAFSWARDLKGRACYQVSVCSDRKTLKSGHMDFKFHHDLKALKKAQTIVIPGTKNITQKLPDSLKKKLIQAHTRGARIVSICSGAFLLAQTELLDGLEATTHWAGTEAFQKKFPLVKLNPNVLYVDSGSIMTSAGAFAGMDLCLHIIRKDFGAAVAFQSAKMAVMPIERLGGQAQFIDSASPLDQSGSLTKTLNWILENLDQEIKIKTLAHQAATSVRTLNRQFQKQLGMGPQAWIIQARINEAKRFLETTDHSIETIAAKVGFGSPITLREHFKKITCTNPTAYRRNYQATSL